MAAPLPKKDQESLIQDIKDGMSCKEAKGKYGISNTTYYKWHKEHYGQLEKKIAKKIDNKIDMIVKKETKPLEAFVEKEIARKEQAYLIEEKGLELLHILTDRLLAIINNKNLSKKKIDEIKKELNEIKGVVSITLSEIRGITGGNILAKTKDEEKQDVNILQILRFDRTEPIKMVGYER